VAHHITTLSGGYRAEGGPDRDDHHRRDAILALLVIAILMGHSHAGNAVIFVGGAVVVAVARMLTAGRSRRR
jgi:hypothetical protein